MSHSMFVGILISLAAVSPLFIFVYLDISAAKAAQNTPCATVDELRAYEGRAISRCVETPGVIRIFKYPPFLVEKYIRVTPKHYELFRDLDKVNTEVLSKFND